MTPEISRMMKRYSTAAAVTSFIVQPIPAIDELAVVPIQYVFAARLARARGVGILKAPWGPVQRIIWTGAAARVFTNMTIGLIPIAGAFANAATAFALTEFLGGYLDTALDEPTKTPPPVTFATLKTAMIDAVKRAAGRWPKVAASASPATAAA